MTYAKSSPASWLDDEFCGILAFLTSFHGHRPGSFTSSRGCIQWLAMLAPVCYNGSHKGLKSCLKSGKGV